jgi:hypothetical protein
MPDEETTGQQPPNSGPEQPGASTPAPTDGAPEHHIDWKARYQGSSQVINNLTRERDDLKGQLETVTSKFEQLQAQLSLKDTEKTVAVGERDKQINEILEAKSQAEQELARLRALERKVKVANKIGDPNLVTVIDTIPDIEDEGTLEAMMTNLTNWKNQAVKARENQLLEGETPEINPTPESDPLPTTNQGWQQYVEQFELGSKERDNAMNAWKDWGIASQRR